MRYLALLLLGLLLAACVPQEGGPPRLHDIAIYNYNGNTLYGYFYGDPITLMSGGRDLVLSRGEAEGPFVVDRAMLVNGQPYLSQAIPPLERRHFDVARVPFSTDLILRTDRAFEEVVYFDGDVWLTVAEDVEAGFDGRVVPRVRLGGLRGLGSLTSAEARMLERVFEEDGDPVALAVFNNAPLPMRQVVGLTEHLRTAIVVQPTIRTNDAAYTPPVQEISWEVLARGNNAAAGEGARFEIATSAAELTRLWNLAYGNQLNMPPVPQLDFRRNSVLAFFLGSRPTGGYGVEVRSVSADEGELFVEVSVSEPGAGAITTQALTSPWVLIRVPRSGVPLAWFRNPQGELIGVARQTQ